jgi:AAA family ATP:ADP antiporter
MLGRIATMLWGKFESKDEINKFGLLALLFALIIGTYWGFRPIKDSIFGAIVGIDYQPWAKWFSLVVIIPLVLFYSKLVDMFPRHKVFYALTILYGCAALAFAYFFSHPVYGLTNTVEDPTRVIGWLWYVYVESFGSLIVALFWAFTTDITKPESAKRGFPMIALFGQMGNIVGPYILTARNLGFSTSAPIVAICGVLIFCMAIILWFFMKIIPARELVGYEMGAEQQGQQKTHKEEEPGFFEGLKLLLTQGYLMGIFLIITIYEVIVTILDFHLKTSAKAAYPIEADNAAYLSSYAVWTGIVATLCVLLGINNIQRHLGMTWSLVLLPILVSLAVCMLWINPSLGVAFWIMVLSKAVNYALNQPTLKQLYIPTTKDVKYKSQAWIEMFGSRGSKAAGSGVNMLRGIFKSKYGVAGISMFLSMSSMISFGFIIGWLFVALFVAKKYNHAIEQNKVIC